MVETDAQVLHQAYLCTGFVVPRHHLVQDRIVACLTDISCRTEYEPHRVVVESAADVVVAALGERLVLMVASAVGELGSGDIQDSLTRTRRDLVHKAHQILIRIAETHATSYAALEE